MGWFEGIANEALFTSVICLGELKAGCALLPPGPLLDRYDAARRELIRWFGARAIGIDARIANAWGALAAANRVRRVRATVSDELIAATAIVHDLTVVTRNVRDFEHAGCKVLSPWSA